MRIGKLHITHLDRIFFTFTMTPFMLYVGYLTLYHAFVDNGIGFGIAVTALLFSVYWIVIPIAWSIFRGGWYYEN